VRLAFDTNILAYVEGVNTAAQQATAASLVRRIPPKFAVLPAQVIGELFNVLTRKARRPATVARTACADWATNYKVIPTTAAVLNDAFDLATQHSLPTWDAVILAAAARARCNFLLSEDMQDGFSWRGVTVANPFGATPLPTALAALLTSRP
jgi:predicted nucleic acid-binding protein